MKPLPIAAVALLTLAHPAAQSPAPDAYRVTFDYYFANPQGSVGRRERVTGSYVVDAPGGTATWTGVSIAAGKGMEAFGPGAPRAFMERFAYPVRVPAQTMLGPDFFGDVPVTAVQERNLVIDTRMFEMFADELDRLRPGVPYAFDTNREITIDSWGTFTNRDLKLTLTGTVVRNGEDCAVIDYVALFNRVDLALPGFTLVGRSHYWGQIWVARGGRRLEHATLYEDVLGEVTQGGGEPASMNVFRVGTLERAAR